MTKNTKYPVAEKYQRKARLRRLCQQLRDGRINQAEHDESVRLVEKDYKERRR